MTIVTIKEICGEKKRSTKKPIKKDGDSCTEHLQDNDATSVPVSFVQISLPYPYGAA